jgi:hypothetical protein
MKQFDGWIAKNVCSDYDERFDKDYLSYVIEYE